MRWQDKLTSEELQHVRKYSGATLSGFKSNRKAQLEMIANFEKSSGRKGSEPCFLCKIIARKLGIE